ncbi:hypothetical protein ACHAXA_009237 [Cyclostephanos tholiformis]|uniref:Uncharacterized protein n=1 Tax=Cyclostephanos tholiformis TaxID=382380 RepID=A0ABD3R741_9STRA
MTNRARGSRRLLVPFGLLLAPLILFVVPSSTNAAAFLLAPYSSTSSRPSSSPHRVSPSRSSPWAVVVAATGAGDDDGSCGCASSTPSATAAVVISGSPSELARAIDVRDALRSSSATEGLYRLDGSAVSSASTILGSSDGISLLEQILQYSNKRNELANANVHTSLISIGKPEVGLSLCEHLGVRDGMDWIYADPNNGLYDALMTNRGWDSMIRPATALRFKDRIFGGKEGGSLDQLFEVLGKWNKAFYIPPKLEQSTIHGGTFVLSPTSVLFAHYDESPGTHADPGMVVDIAICEASRL